RAVPLNGGSGSVVLRGKLPEVAAGPHLLAVALRDAGDAEPRTDLRLHLLSVTPTPGIVIVGAPASWESRFLFRTLLDVAALPVRGYFLMEGSRWRRMGDLTAATAAEVERAAQQADLLVQVGVAGLWRWAFRGGSSEQGYRSWVAATTAWLLGASDSVTGRARPLRAVVQQGRPVVFERARPDSGPVGIELRITGGAAATRRDTLRFDGAGRAELFLQPGR